MERDSKFRVSKLADIVGETVTQSILDNVPRLGASLAFYVVLSLAPMLVITIAIVALAYGKESAQSNLLVEVRRWIGPDGAIVVNGLFKGMSQQRPGGLTMSFGFAILAFGASSAVLELREALNAIWNRTLVCPPSLVGGFNFLLRERFYSFLLLLGAGGIFLITLLLQTIASKIALLVGARSMLDPITLQLMSSVMSWLTAAAVFSAIYKILPDVKLKWIDVILGATTTSILFMIGKNVIGFYLVTLGLATTYGAAGSLVALLVWVYYSAQILFFGAELTKVYARSYGSQRPLALQSGAGSYMPQAGGASAAGMYKSSRNSETEV